MNADTFTVLSSVLPDDTRLAGFRGSEGISRLYQFEVYLLMGALGLTFDMEDAIGAKACLVGEVENGPPFLVNGMFSSLQLVHDMGDRSLFRATLVPHLWQLTQTLHSRIFTNMSIPDILREVFDDSGLSVSQYVFKLLNTYPPEEHVCQYRESNFDFISRWMEREGLYYYFDQTEGGEVLVITDNVAFQQPLPRPPVRFFASSAGTLGGLVGEALHSFTCKYSALPAQVKVTDYDYMNPALEVSGVAPVSPFGLGEISDFGTRCFSPSDGLRQATLRAEALRARRVVFQGSGTAKNLRPGGLFSLVDHPRPSFDAAYLVVGADHVVSQHLAHADFQALTGIDLDEGYRVDVTAIPAGAQFRPSQVSPWPRIYGFEAATVCGPADSDYAQIDDSGRYNVKFKFDESDLADGNASTFIRMMQPHGGSVEGFHFPLRKGTEVVITFFGGDPDRPVIAGVVPNALNPSPVTQSNNTRNVIQTGGRNRMEFEDEQGSERMTFQTPHTNTMIRMGSPNCDHNLIFRTDGTSLYAVGESYDMRVGFEDSTKKYCFTRAVSADGVVDETTEKDWSLTSEKGNINVKAEKGSINVTADTDTINVKAEKGSINVTADTDSINVKAEKGSIIVTADKQNIMVTAEAGLVQLESGGTAGINILSEKGSSAKDIWVESKAGGILVECTTGKFAVECKDWDLNNLGNHSEFVLGTTSTEFTLGMKTETYVGLAHETFLGGKLELNGGVCIETFLGPKFEFNPVGKFEIPALHIKSAALENAEAATAIGEVQLQLGLLALELKTAGLIMMT